MSQQRILTIVESAYRATLEEQDDPVLWLTAVLSGQGANVDLLLKGSAVNYAVKGQDASGLRFGAKAQTQPPRLERDIAGLLGKGVNVFYLEEDAGRRGIGREELIGGVRAVRGADLPGLFEEYGQVWQW